MKEELDNTTDWTHSDRLRHWHITEIHGGSWSGIQLRNDPKTTSGHGSYDNDDDNEDINHVAFREK